MTDTHPGEEASLFPKTAGERLREAREAQGLSLAEIAARTRIPVRQLEAIETSNFSALPSITYSVGFAKAYARAVGADEVAIAREIRGKSDVTTRHTEYESYEVTDSSRTPAGGLVLVGAVVAVLLLVGVGLWYGTTWFRGDQAAAPAPVTQAAQVPRAPPTAAPTPVGGQVRLTATDEVWLRVYDSAGKTLYESTLKAGDHYDVPPDANNPMINVGRPDKLQITVNGSNVPALGDGSHAIQDVAISAAALTARANGTPLPTPTGIATPGIVAAAGAAAPARPTPARRPAAARPRPADSTPTPTPAASPPVVTPPPAAAVPSASATNTP